MKSFVKYLFLLFVSFNFIFAFASDEDKTPKLEDKEVTGAQERLAELNNQFLDFDNGEGCHDSPQKDTKDCQKIIKKQKYLKNIVTGAITNASDKEFNKYSCKGAYSEMNKSITEAKSNCAKAGIPSYNNCKKQAAACLDDGLGNTGSLDRATRTSSLRSSKPVCTTSLLEGLGSNREIFKELKEESTTAKNAFEAAQEDLNRLQLRLIEKQNAFEDAKLVAEKVVRDAEKENEQKGQEAVQKGLSIQIDIDKARFEIEDLKSSKSIEFAKAKNAVEDANLDCYGIAAKQYSDEYNSCLVRKNQKISSGRYSTNSLKFLFSDSRHGSCSQKDKKAWIEKYQMDCSENKVQKAKIDRIKKQYKEQAKNFNTRIKRMEIALAKLISQQKTFQDNLSKANLLILKDQEAAAAAAALDVQTIGKEIGLLQRDIFDKESKLRKLQSDLEDVNRNKNTVKDSNTEDTRTIKKYGSDKIDRLDKMNDAFGLVYSAESNYNNAIEACNCDKNNNSADADPLLCTRLKRKASGGDSPVLNSSGSGSGTN